MKKEKRYAEITQHMRFMAWVLQQQDRNDIHLFTIREAMQCSLDEATDLWVTWLYFTERYRGDVQQLGEMQEAFRQVDMQDVRRLALIHDVRRLVRMQAELEAREEPPVALARRPKGYKDHADGRRAACQQQAI